MLNSVKLQDINPLLINLTGIRVLVIFSLLLEAPRTAEEINEYFVQNNYPKELFSIDTLRNDMNALRLAGCDISRADKHNDFKYILNSHPFELNINMTIAKSIANVYNRVYKDLSMAHLLMIDDLFNELAKYTVDEETSEYFRSISLIRNIDKSILKDLIKAKENHNKIGLTYKSPNSGKQNLEFSIDSLEFRNKKLYFCGYCYTYESNSFLLVSKIVSPITFYLNKEFAQRDTKTAIYELKNVTKMYFSEKVDEKIISQTENAITVEFTTDNKFKLLQKILSYGPDCTVISPEEVRQDIINMLRKMREVYKNA